jgi:hypothetical protein
MSDATLLCLSNAAQQSLPCASRDAGSWLHKCEVNVETSVHTLGICVALSTKKDERDRNEKEEHGQ